MLILHLAYEQNSIYLWGRGLLRQAAPSEARRGRIRGAAVGREARGAARRAQGDGRAERAQDQRACDAHIHIAPREGRRPRAVGRHTRRRAAVRGRGEARNFPRSRASGRVRGVRRDAAHDARVRRKDTGPRNNPRRRFQIPLPRARVRGGARAARDLHPRHGAVP